MPIRVVVAGAGGHAVGMLEFLLADPELVFVGYVAPEVGSFSQDLPYVGDDRLLPDLRRQGIEHALLGVAGAADNERRRRVFEHWRRAGFNFIHAIHGAAVVSSWARYGEGLQCLAGAAINAHAVLGVNVIVNTSATVEHDCVLGDHVHIGPGAVLCGGVTVGETTLIGAGATVIPAITIGANVVVGAGSVVTRNLENGSRVAGNPARPIRSRQHVGGT